MKSNIKTHQIKISLNIEILLNPKKIEIKNIVFFDTLICI